MNARLVQLFLIVLAGVLITACGALPQEETGTIQIETPPVISPTLSVAESRGIIVTPTITYITAPITDQSLPSSSQAITIGNYLLNPARLILETNEPIELIQWLPDSDEELLIRSATMDTFIIDRWNIATGQRKRVAETSSLASNPVWLPQTQQVAFVKQRGDQFDLYLSDPGAPAQATLVARDVGRPLALAHDQTTLLFFDGQMSGLQTINQELTRIPSLSLAKALPVVNGGILPHYQAAWHEKVPWIAYYNQERFYLVNIQTREEKLVNLNALPSGQPEVDLWVDCAKWDPDGKKLALIIASGQYLPLDFTKLAIFDPDTNQLKIIEDNVRYVVDIAWSPDSQYIVLETHRASIKGRSMIGLSIVDSKSNEINSLPLIPSDASQTVFCNGLTWLSNGRQSILLTYAEKAKDGKKGWYIIEVVELLP
jgi:dipeptidyl aminopeptidase/acylaminoacyl peptidase